ncbi:hypothetical protein F4553_000927 [Allocatelliglobosispora scoriae]|uniref:Tox-PL domain-containing protein n=1 Tax=Allocatelliglobosispora scoriae TaxID=643052 RepID=A0A841BJN7_9ACTN|nr:toxin glutamine deamidase domain-containing protein [Allocatelliglobosispora scoriae]MBB5867548.1 hypothetical protein [Allocatelliglobosispora scoriae]
MGIELPDFGDPWNGIRDMVIFVANGGGTWPSGDETQIRELAEAWRGVEKALRDGLPAVQSAGNDLSILWSGPSGALFRTNWEQLGGTELSEELYELIGKVVADADQAALDIEYEKISTIVSLVVLMIEIFVIIVMAVIAFYGAMAAAGVRIAMTRAAVTTMFRLLVEKATQSFGRVALSQFLRRAVVRGLPLEILREVGAETGTDVTAQVSQFLMGTRVDWDGKKTFLAGLGGAVGAALSVPGLIGGNLVNGLDNVVARAAARFLNDFGDEVITETGAQFVVNGVGYGQWQANFDNLLANTLGGMARDRFSAGARLSDRITEHLTGFLGGLLPGPTYSGPPSGTGGPTGGTGTQPTGGTGTQPSGGRGSGLAPAPAPAPAPRAGEQGEPGAPLVPPLVAPSLSGGLAGAPPGGLRTPPGLPGSGPTPGDTRGGAAPGDARGGAAPGDSRNGAVPGDDAAAPDGGPDTAEPGAAAPDGGPGAAAPTPAPADTDTAGSPAPGATGDSGLAPGPDPTPSPVDTGSPSAVEGVPQGGDPGMGGPQQPDAAAPVAGAGPVAADTPLGDTDQVGDADRTGHPEHGPDGAVAPGGRNGQESVPQLAAAALLGDTAALQSLTALAGRWDLAVGHLVQGTGFAATLPQAERHRLVTAMIDERVPQLAGLTEQQSAPLRAELVHAAGVTALARQVRTAETAAQRQAMLALADPSIARSAVLLASISADNLTPALQHLGQQSLQAQAALAATTDPAVAAEAAVQLAVHRLTSELLGESTPESGLTYPGPDLGFDPASGNEEEALRAELPREGDRFTPHPDPLGGLWVSLLNDGGISRPGRGTNCVEATIAALSTWLGHPAVAAAQRLGSGERARRLESWVQGRLSPQGSGQEALAGIAAQLLAAGHGAATVVALRWAGSRAPGHMLLAVNHHGTVVWIDGALGTVSMTPPYAGTDLVGPVSALALDATGRPLRSVRADLPPVPASRERFEGQPVPAGQDPFLATSGTPDAAAVLARVQSLSAAPIGTATVTAAPVAGTSRVLLTVEPARGGSYTVELTIGVPPSGAVVEAAAGPGAAHRATISEGVAPSDVELALAQALGLIDGATERGSLLPWRTRTSGDSLVPGLPTGPLSLSPQDRGRMQLAIHSAGRIAAEDDTALRQAELARLLARLDGMGLRGDGAHRRWSLVADLLADAPPGAAQVLELLRQGRPTIQPVSAVSIAETARSLAAAVVADDLGGTVRQLPGGDLEVQLPGRRAFRVRIAEQVVPSPVLDRSVTLRRGTYVLSYDVNLDPVRLRALLARDLHLLPDATTLRGSGIVVHHASSVRASRVAALRVAAQQLATVDPAARPHDHQALLTQVMQLIDQLGLREGQQGFRAARLRIGADLDLSVLDTHGGLPDTLSLPQQQALRQARSVLAAQAEWSAPARTISPLSLRWSLPGEYRAGFAELARTRAHTPLAELLADHQGEYRVHSTHRLEDLLRQQSALHGGPDAALAALIAREPTLSRQGEQRLWTLLGRFPDPGLAATIAALAPFDTRVPDSAAWRALATAVTTVPSGLTGPVADALAAATLRFVYELVPDLDPEADLTVRAELYLLVQTLAAADPNATAGMLDLATGRFTDAARTALAGRIVADLALVKLSGLDGDALTVARLSDELRTGEINEILQEQIRHDILLLRTGSAALAARMIHQSGATGRTPEARLSDFRLRLVDAVTTPTLVTVRYQPDGSTILDFQHQGADGVLVVSVTATVTDGELSLALTDVTRHPALLAGEPAIGPRPQRVAVRGIGGSTDLRGTGSDQVTAETLAAAQARVAPLLPGTPPVRLTVGNTRDDAPAELRHDNGGYTLVVRPDLPVNGRALERVIADALAQAQAIELRQASGVTAINGDLLAPGAAPHLGGLSARDAGLAAQLLVLAPADPSGWQPAPELGTEIHALVEAMGLHTDLPFAGHRREVLLAHAATHFSAEAAAELAAMLDRFADPDHPLDTGRNDVREIRRSVRENIAADALLDTMFGPPADVPATEIAALAGLTGLAPPLSGAGLATAGATALARHLRGDLGIAWGDVHTEGTTVAVRTAGMFGIITVTAAALPDGVSARIHLDLVGGRPVQAIVLADGLAADLVGPTIAAATTLLRANLDRATEGRPTSPPNRLGQGPLSARDLAGSAEDLSPTDRANIALLVSLAGRQPAADDFPARGQVHAVVDNLGLRGDGRAETARRDWVRTIVGETVWQQVEPYTRALSDLPAREHRAARVGQALLRAVPDGVSGRSIRSPLILGATLRRVWRMRGPGQRAGGRIRILHQLHRRFRPGLRSGVAGAVAGTRHTAGYSVTGRFYVGRVTLADGTRYAAVGLPGLSFTRTRALFANVRLHESGGPSDIPDPYTVDTGDLVEPTETVRINDFIRVGVSTSNVGGPILFQVRRATTVILGRQRLLGLRLGRGGGPRVLLRQRRPDGVESVSHAAQLVISPLYGASGSVEFGVPYLSSVNVYGWLMTGLDIAVSRRISAEHFEAVVRGDQGEFAEFGELFAQARRDLRQWWTSPRFHSDPSVSVSTEYQIAEIAIGTWIKYLLPGMTGPPWGLGLNNNIEVAVNIAVEGDLDGPAARFLGRQILRYGSETAAQENAPEAVPPPAATPGIAPPAGTAPVRTPHTATPPVNIPVAPVHPDATPPAGGDPGGNWPTVDAVDGGAVAQLHPLSCVSACGEMLSGRPQAELMELVGVPGHAGRLVQVLGGAWRGGYVGPDVLDIFLTGPPWAAELFGPGAEIAHTVVVDGVREDGLILIRDPWDGGSTYAMTRADFLQVWNGIAVFGGQQ